MFHWIGENEEFRCKVKSEGGEGYYEPPEMQWIVGDGYPSYNENPYEKVSQLLSIASILHIFDIKTIFSVASNSYLNIFTERNGWMAKHVSIQTSDRGWWKETDVQSGKSRTNFGVGLYWSSCCHVFNRFELK